MAQKTFEVNGKVYDALTGAYVGPAKYPPLHVSVRPMQPKTAPSANSLDGMVATSLQKQRQPVAPQHISAHRPQPTKTLMRRAVKAPGKPLSMDVAPSRATLISPLAPVQQSQPLQPSVQTKHAATHIDPLRARRARHAAQSQAVTRFRSPVPAPSNPYTLPIEPKPAMPAAASTPIRPAQPAAPQQPSPMSRRHPMATAPQLLCAGRHLSAGDQGSS